MGVFAYKIDILRICRVIHFVLLFYNSIRISISWLFRTCFHTKIFSKCNFCTHYKADPSTIPIESVKFRNTSRITVTSLSNLLRKLLIWVFEYYACYCFLKKRSCKTWLNITLPKNKLMQKFMQHWGMRQRKNSQKEKSQI